VRVPPLGLVEEQGFARHPDRVEGAEDGGQEQAPVGAVALEICGYTAV